MIKILLKKVISLTREGKILQKTKVLDIRNDDEVTRYLELKEREDKEDLEDVKV